MRIALLEDEQSQHVQGIICGRGESCGQSCDAFKTGVVQAQVIAAND
ncbi:hypothetical protein MIH18_05130 [Marinobacter sp. M3C]|nr:hypothetical protein [Marinobacter sp. M3C]MCL1477762.1 hypothetical protein [Marinobacter sp.]MCL1481272.1 hypothetical protein [Marinobacter sp.]MCL1484704.1 hypothetical protein [Marinobacter sp.]UQG61332.1 hypothetical protein MIH18_05130 [Marinobacter sp. M3C]